LSPERVTSYSIQTRVGRLIEARVFQLLTRADADEYSHALGREVAKHASHAPILLADHRPVTIYPQPASDRLVELFQDMNRRIERIAIIVAPSNATIYLQLHRLVREAGFEARQVFKEAKPALDHLAVALGADELRRAQAFLEEHR
jgi:hypothetical protein